MAKSKSKHSKRWLQINRAINNGVPGRGSTKGPKPEKRREIKNKNKNK